ncbi:hypothetical protein WG66_010554 [Moniliophthora roreri]|nr:hypothetical protein WG66_010554 [Moniliophthora roreri]
MSSVPYLIDDTLFVSLEHVSRHGKASVAAVIFKRNGALEFSRNLVKQLDLVKLEREPKHVSEPKFRRDLIQP